jgi:hypothetical protein
MSKEIKFTKFPTELSEDQLLDLSDYDEAEGFGMQDVIVTEEGFWLQDVDNFEERKKHYLKLYEVVIERSED